MTVYQHAHRSMIVTTRVAISWYMSKLIAASLSLCAAWPLTNGWHAIDGRESVAKPPSVRDERYDDERYVSFITYLSSRMRLMGEKASRSRRPRTQPSQEAAAAWAAAVAPAPPPARPHTQRAPGTSLRGPAGRAKGRRMRTLPVSIISPFAVAWRRCGPQRASAVAHRTMLRCRVAAASHVIKRWDACVWLECPSGAAGARAPITGAAVLRAPRRGSDGRDACGVRDERYGTRKHFYGFSSSVSPTRRALMAGVPACGWDTAALPEGGLV